jgi:hypothetical protein
MHKMTKMLDAFIALKHNGQYEQAGHNQAHPNS